MLITAKDYEVAFGGDENVLCLGGGEYMHLSKHSGQYFKWPHFIICKLYHNKVYLFLKLQQTLNKSVRTTVINGMNMPMVLILFQ